jgi:hypothetical protein
MTEHGTQLSQQAEVALIFPPLVQTNFGSYYPSTAVLAAFLSQRSIQSCQIDLNEEFAMFLLRPSALGEMAAGRFWPMPPRAPDAMECVAARLLARNRDMLFDSMGRHAFNENNDSPAHLINHIVRPCSVDLPVKDLVQTGLHNLVVTPVYTEFLQWSAIAKRLPCSVHTVGISIPMGPQLMPSLLFAQYIRAIRPDIMIVMGGPTLSLMAEEDIALLLSNFPEIDALVRYDGELPLSRLVEQKRKGIWNPKLIPNISYSRNGEVIHNAPAPGLSVNDLPFAEYDHELLNALSQPQIGIIQARGCYWGKCAYCDYVELYDGSPSFRSRATPHFLQEVKHQIEVHGVRQFSLITEALPPGFARRLSDALIQEEIHIKWHSFAMVDDRFSTDLLEKMALAGCQDLVVGVENMNSRVLKFVRKAATQEHNIQFFLRTKTSGIGLTVNLIPNLPSTTYDEAMEGLAILREYRDCFSHVSVFPFEATMSSAIGRDPEAFRLTVVKQGEGVGQAQFSGNHLEIIDQAMSREELERVIVEYQGFASEVNAGSKVSDGIKFANSPHDDVEFRFSDEYVDVMRAEYGTVQCYNWATRERILVNHAGWYPLVLILRKMGWFRKQAFLDIFADTEVGEVLFDQLIQNRFMVVRTEESLERRG